jgi:DNA-binding NarL/FixJ family response regulator
MVDSIAVRSTSRDLGPEAGPRRGRVLIADRRRLYREALAHLLAATPGIVQVATTATLEDALEACRAEEFDAALVHVDSLPGRRADAAAELIDERPALRVVIVAEDGDFADASQAGGHEVVSSTDPLERLVAFVRSIATDHRDGVTVLRSTTRGPQLVPKLTPRELEVLQLLAAGGSTEQSARALHVSPLTIRSHVKSILGKLGAHSKLEAVTDALRLGLITLPPASG